MDEMIFKNYNRWLNEKNLDKDLLDELNSISKDLLSIEDAFYRNLEFGTGGLRGVLGAGTNRMNIYTVAKASQGLSDYILKNYIKERRKIAISYDSRIKSKEFARVAAEVFAANDIEAYIYKELMPTPCLSYAVRELKCAAGIMITASHNPSNYNGYKVYGTDGCQITTNAAQDILDEIEKLDIFEDVKKIDFNESLNSGKIQYIDDDIYTNYIEKVKMQSMFWDKKWVIDKDVSIVYSPLNGTGLKPVMRALREAGFTNIKTVFEQEQPDGRFPTCPYPNPEIRETMELGIKYAKRYNADLFLATDPDCDRVGIAIKDNDKYTLLSGNEVGVLLLDYICELRVKNKTMPDNPIFVKTIVTSDMATQIAENYNVKTINVLTGFKFIGEQIGILEAKNEKDNYIFGMEESYGYLSGTYVRDKDAVNAAFMICEMFAYYKTQGITLIQKLDELYKKYGYRLNTLHSYEFDGVAGAEKIHNIMKLFRDDINSFGGRRVISVIDYNNGIDGLPKSNVLKFELEDNCSVVVRPSGTEPKIKLYISVTAENMEAAAKIEEMIISDLVRKIK